MHDWTDQQQAVWAHLTNRRPLAVIARAGTAKTTTIHEALKRLPEGAQALYLAFGREDAEHAKRTLRLPNVTAQTCHAFGYAQVRENLGPVEVVLDRVRTLAPTSYKRLSFAVAKAVNLARAHLVETEDDLNDLVDEYNVTDDPRVRPQVAPMAIRVLSQLATTERDSIDHEDMVWLPVAMGLSVQQYDFVFLDEAQDLTPAQCELALRAVKPDGKLVLVGDPAQGVYAFRGAGTESMEQMIARTGAETLPLSISFRCARSIIAEAQRWVPDIQAAPNAPVGAVRHVSLDRAIDEVEYGDAVVSRTNAPLVRIATRLAVDGCAVRFLGRDLGDSLVNLIYSLGSHTPERLIQDVRNWALVQERRALRSDPPDKAAASAARDRAECVEAIAATCPTVPLVVAKIRELLIDNGPRDAVTLTTCHKAKGREWDRVFVLRNTFRPQEGGQEQNLMYVAVTRAKTQLVYVGG